MVRSRVSLGPYLDRLAADYGSDFLDTDPLGEVRRFDDPDDREVAAFLAAGLAFGRVDLILAHLRDLWRRLDDRPARRADRWRPADARRLDGFVHRWVRGADLAVVIPALGRLRRRHGSLGALFALGYAADDRDLARPLARFVNAIRDEARAVAGLAQHEPLPRGVETFLADPVKGGACKRLNLFLRWMIRPDDGLDLGLWPAGRPDQLVVPLDTHVARISRYLGLTARRTVDWKMAGEVTDSLRRFDAGDPVRYDFAIARLGILDRCPRRVDPDRCRACSLVAACTLGGPNHGRS